MVNTMNQLLKSLVEEKRKLRSETEDKFTSEIQKLIENKEMEKMLVEQPIPFWIEKSRYGSYLLKSNYKDYLWEYTLYLDNDEFYINIDTMCEWGGFKEKFKGDNYELDLEKLQLYYKVKNVIFDIVNSKPMKKLEKYYNETKLLISQLGDEIKTLTEQLELLNQQQYDKEIKSLLDNGGTLTVNPTYEWYNRPDIVNGVGIIQKRCVFETNYFDVYDYKSKNFVCKVEIIGRIVGTHRWEVKLYSQNNWFTSSVGKIDNFDLIDDSKVEITKQSLTKLLNSILMYNNEHWVDNYDEVQNEFNSVLENSVEG
jgi:hypothetical protein